MFVFLDLNFLSQIFSSSIYLPGWDSWICEPVGLWILCLLLGFFYFSGFLLIFIWCFPFYQVKLCNSCVVSDRKTTVAFCSAVCLQGQWDNMNKADEDRGHSAFLGLCGYAEVLIATSRHAYNTHAHSIHEQRYTHTHTIKLKWQHEKKTF